MIELNFQIKKKIISGEREIQIRVNYEWFYGQKVISGKIITGCALN